MCQSAGSFANLRRTRHVSILTPPAWMAEPWIWQLGIWRGEPGLHCMCLARHGEACAFQGKNGPLPKNTGSNRRNRRSGRTRKKGFDCLPLVCCSWQLDKKCGFCPSLPISRELYWIRPFSIRLFYFLQCNCILSLPLNRQCISWYISIQI